MDWRALSQVKEMGIYVKSCPCMANDLSKIYGIWSYLGKSLNSTAAMGYPTQYDTIYNEKTPIHLNDNFNGSISHIGSSPETINSQFRSSELTSLLNHIKAAKSFVYISVMDYVPFEIYGSSSSYSYWGELDEAMKSAVARGVDVNLLVSKWNSTKSQMYIGLENLQNFGRFCLPSGYYQWCKGNLTVKLMELPNPTGYDAYPFTRVNHAKYVVTDQASYISTSNWSKDYFYSTLGVGLFTTNYQIKQDLKTIFLRDFNSKYSSNLNPKPTNS
jgi:phospholipase D3/4